MKINNQNQRKIPNRKQAQLGSTLTLLFATIVLIFILLIFFVLAQIPGISKHENALVKENVDELLNKSQEEKTNLAFNNTIININENYYIIYSIYSVNLANIYSLQINNLLSEINSKIKWKIKKLT